MVEEYLMDLQTLEANVKEMNRGSEVQLKEVNIIHDSVQK